MKSRAQLQLLAWWYQLESRYSHPVCDSLLCWRHMCFNSRSWRRNYLHPFDA